MPRRKLTRRQRNGQQRRAMAQEGQEHLIALLNDPKGADERLLRSSADHLVRLSRRHRMTVPAKARHLFCRKCRTPHRFGINARVRINGGQRIITCLECTNVRRFGGGPKAHRKNKSTI
ncbi:MAG: hypothetical protein QNL85_08410 [Euryarchaeota archaeon]